MSSRVFVGVSGFSYPTWRGRFYPKEIGPDDFLKYYSQNLNSVEINSSFYALPSLATVRSWHGKTGDAFKFAFKAPRKITHLSKLGEGAAETALDMSKNLEALGDKRGPILFQLPPFLRQTLNLLEGFLSQTSNIPDRVFEFRHQSWLVDSTYALLDKYDTGFCIAETEDLEPVLKTTGHLAYFRLRKDSYDAKMIEKWVVKIKKAMENADQTFVYLRHDETGENAELAQKLKPVL